MWKTSVTCTTICSQIDRGIPFSVYPSSAPHPGRYSCWDVKQPTNKQTNSVSACLFVCFSVPVSVRLSVCLPLFLRHRHRHRQTQTDRHTHTHARPPARPHAHTHTHTHTSIATNTHPRQLNLVSFSCFRPRWHHGAREWSYMLRPVLK